MSGPLKIGFLGSGKMSSALAKGFIQAGLVTPQEIIGSDPIESSRSHFSECTGARTTAFNPDVVQFAPVIFLGVKPDQVNDLLADIRPHFSEKHLLISIAAGVPLARLEGALASGSRMIRVMPNTPALIGASAAGFTSGKNATSEDAQLCLRLLSAVGVAFQVKESLLDAVTGLSGSGPAYVYMMIEALSDGGVAAGLPRDVATRLAAQTVLGSAKMVLETGQHPAVLKDMVTSPGGTTIEGLHELEKANVRGALMNAVRAATAKARQLGQS